MPEPETNTAVAEPTPSTGEGNSAPQGSNPQQLEIPVQEPNSPVKPEETAGGQKKPESETGSPAPTQEEEAVGEWKGDVSTLPKSLQGRAQGVLRYLTKQSQAIAEDKKLAEEFRRLQGDPLFIQAVNQLKGQSAMQQQAPAPIYTREELEEAQINPDKLGSLIDRVVDTRLRQAEQQVGGILSQLQTKQTFIDKKQEIQDFAELHPDFWDLHDRGLMKPFLREIVDTGQGTIMDAYSKAKEVREKIRQEVFQETQTRVNQKKAAFSATPTPSSEPEIIWASDKNEATRLAFENALQGKKVQVKVKR